VGRQVGYANYPEDVVPLEAFIRGTGDVLFLRPHATAPEPARLDSLLMPASELRHMLLIARTVDVPRLRWRHLPAQRMWSIDTDASPVIEYSPGYDRDGTPRFPKASGAYARMWFRTRTWDGDTPVTAPEDFIAWADRLLGWVRRNWILIDDFYYFSPTAAEAWEAMWQVVVDEPWIGPGAEQISRWRRAHDPDNLMSPDDFHAVITKAKKYQPKRLIISVRRQGVNSHLD
jgi:hypothetical protein